MKTEIIISGVSYVFESDFESLYKKLGDDEEVWVDMMERDKQLSFSDYFGSIEPMSIDSMVSIISVLTTDSQMDGWDPCEEDE